MTPGCIAVFIKERIFISVMEFNELSAP